MADGGDPIMDAPIDADQETSRRYIRARNRSGGLFSAVGLLCLAGALLGFWITGTVAGAGLGAALGLVAGLFLRGQSTKARARKEHAATLAAAAVENAMKTQQIAEAEARGDFDRWKDKE